MQQVDVSIYVPTYNHENYIVQALEGIRMQQTQYTYEVLVGEDCSTDNTRQILKDWEQAHNDPRFKIFYRETNMHKLPVGNGLDLKQRCTGRYIICLEGDDFWTDPLKLQKQVSFLDSHPEYIAVAHNCTVVDHDGNPNGETYPECKDEEYSFSHYFSDILPGQFATLMSRNYQLDNSVDQTLINKRCGPGDRKVYFTLLCHGKIHCIQESLSAYRHVTAFGSSFSANFKYDYDKEEMQYRQYLEYAYSLNHKTAIKYIEYLYLRTIRHALRTKKVDKARANADKKRILHPLRAQLLLFKRDINCRILHKTLHV